MTEGAEHYGVNKEYIDKLKSYEVQPRRLPEEFVSYEIAEDAPTMSLEEMKAGTGKDGAPIYCSINGKVLEYAPAEENDKIKSFVMAMSAGK